jgi:hypothetical protein
MNIEVNIIYDRPELSERLDTQERRVRDLIEREPAAKDRLAIENGLQIGVD